MIRLTTILLFITLQASATTNWHFSNSGNDGTGNGSVSTPYATITKLNLLTLTSGDSVSFFVGHSFFGSITQTTNGITYTSYGGSGKATLTGLLSLTSWSNLGSNIWSAAINSGSYMDVLVLGNAFIMQGRSPNAGSYWNIDSRIQATGGSGDAGWTGQSLTSSSLSTNFTGGRAYIRKNAFNIDNDVITGYSGTTITYATYNGNPINNNGNKFFIQSHLATVTAQNEWYYDPVAHVVKMYSTTDPSSAGLKAAQYDFAFRINNTTGTNSHDISFTNLIFQGYDSLALSFVGCNNITIKNNEFYNIGANAISVTGANVSGPYSTQYGDNLCNNLTVENNKIRYCGNSGINSSFTSSGLHIRFNDIDSCGIYEGMGLPNNQQRDGIQIEYPGGATGSVNNDSVVVYGNMIQHVGYCGIRFQGQKAEVSYNYVDGFGVSMSDGGGIYCSRNAGDSAAGYRRVHHNIVMNGLGQNNTMSGGGTGGMPGIYYDDRSVNIMTDSNTVASVTRDDIFLHNTRNITVQGNKFYNNNDDAAIGSEYDGLEPGFSTRGLIIQNNYIYANTGKLMHLYSYTGSDVASYGTINNNYYSRTSTLGMLLAQEGGTTHFYTSVASWNAGYGYDALSTYRTTLSDSSILLSNPTLTSAPKTFAGITYRDLLGFNYSDGLTLPSFESKPLYQVTYIQPISTGTYIYNQNKQKRVITKQ